jgi:peroxiredoxin
MLLESNEPKLNTDIIDFHLKGTDEKIYSLNNFKDKKIIVIVFMCNHCPYVKAVIDRLTGLQKEFESKSVQFIGINPNDEEAYPEDSFENMKIFFRDREMNFPYLRDDTQEIAKLYDAVCTPDIYVYNGERILKYRGRLDDNWKEESKVTRRELYDAINNIIEGNEPDKIQNPSLGCSIKWKL